MKVVITFAVMAMLAASTTLAQCPSKGKCCSGEKKKDAKNESVECSKCKGEKDKGDSASDK